MSEQILAASQRLDLDLVVAELEYQPPHSFRCKAQPRRWLYIRVDKGLASFDGFVLDTSRFDVGGIRDTDSSRQPGAWLFSDRGPDPPGDNYDAGMIVCLLDCQPAVEGLISDQLPEALTDAGGLLALHRVEADDAGRP